MEAEKKIKAKRRDATKKWLKSNAWIPQDTHPDLFDMCEALSEAFTDVDGVFLQPRNEAKAAEAVYKSKVASGHLPQKGSDTGDWDYVRYLPEWTDPDYKENLIHEPEQDVLLRNTVRDAIYNLRPALRFEDQIRNPTPYAMRFGIAHGRLDGRSRLSPTWSRTRNPFDDFATQVDMMDGAERAEAERRTREAHQKPGAVPPPGETISPQVVQDMLSQRGLLSNDELAKYIEQNAAREVSLDEAIQQLEKHNPRILQAHRAFINNLREDQSYQRMLMTGMTTDELITTGCHIISDDAVIDLDNDIHPLFARDHWDSSAWRGDGSDVPKYVYNINGERAEWVVPTNDALWEAMQPGLRLASMVLEKKHPHMEAIFDLNTRFPISPDQDKRSRRRTAFLTEYRLHEDIYAPTTYTAIRELNDRFKYDWKAETMRILLDHLAFDIGPFMTLSGRVSKTTGIAELEESFGSTNRIEEKDPDSCLIVITIAGECLWPLLVPQYSAAEKLMASFSLAETILHELGHAICIAQATLTEQPWAVPAGQPREVTTLVQSLDGKLWNMKKESLPTEPYFKHFANAELGFDLERALWGFTTNVMVGSTRWQGMPRHLAPQATAFAGVVSKVTPDFQRYTKTTTPNMAPRKTLPFQYFARFFRKSFWEDEYPTYGARSMQILPDQPIPKNIVTNMVPNTLLGSRLFGEDMWPLIEAVYKILAETRQHILSVYLESAVEESLNGMSAIKAWMGETKYWRDDPFSYYPLQKDIETLWRLLSKCEQITAESWADDQQAEYERYLQNHIYRLGPPMSLSERQNHVRAEWDDSYRVGGRIMKELVTVHNGMQYDLGAHQCLVFTLLTSAASTRRAAFERPQLFGLYNNESPVVVVVRRLEQFLKEARDIEVALNEISMMPQISHIKSHYETWRDRFRYNAEEYQWLKTLMNDEDWLRPDEKDAVWKAQFRRVPTWNWTPLYKQYGEMAKREYRRLDPAVRKVLDECLFALRSTTPSVEFALFDEVRVMRDLEVTLRPFDISDPTGDHQGNGASIFNYNKPKGPISPLMSYKTPSGIPASKVTAPGVSPASNNPPAEFGVPASIDLKTTPLRRVLPTGGGSRIQKKPRTRARDSPYLKYSSQSPWAKAKAADLFKEGLPKAFAGLLTLSPRQKRTQLQTQPQVQLPTRTQANTQAQPQTQTQSRFPIMPFPNPYANRIVLTAEIEAFKEAKRLADQAAGKSKKASGVYKTAKLWREKR
ncbi:hypothetical protein GGS20DRAFT_492803 [Poronia punctata]|nr:hypothetical protein GGS20DRAFT_492803 [Poronia punctata]